MPWNEEISRADDPLAAYQGKPVISQGSGGTYVGRVVLELWDASDGTGDDAGGLAITSDAADGDHSSLLNRVTSALPVKVARGVFTRPQAP